MSFFTYDRSISKAHALVTKTILDMDAVYPKGKGSDNQRDIVGMLVQIENCLLTVKNKIDAEREKEAKDTNSKTAEPGTIDLYSFNIYCSKAKKPKALAGLKHTLGFFKNPLKIHSKWDTKKKMHRVYCESEDESLIKSIGDLMQIGAKKA